MRSYFPDEEIRATGADPADVQDVMLYRANIARQAYGKPWMLLHNGLTTGAHDSPEHPAGLAMDFYTGEQNPDIPRIIALAVAAGFCGIGVYRNERGVYSFHIDLRSELTIWYGYREQEGDPWTYTNSIWRIV